MSRHDPTDPVPTASFQGRKHEYVATGDGELELVAVSPGCVCKDCCRKRAAENGSRR